MKNILFVLLTASLLFACTPSDSIKVKGSFPSAQDGAVVYLQKLNQNNQPVDIDTTRIYKGEFSFTLPKTETTEIAFINFKNLNQNQMFFHDKDNIQATFSTEEQFEVKITGGRDNNLLNEYNEKMMHFYNLQNENQKALEIAIDNGANSEVVKLQTKAAILDNEALVYKKTFVKQNINTLVAMLVLNDIVTKRELNVDEIDALLEQRNPDLFDNVFITNMIPKIDQMRLPHVGGIAPDFSGPNPDGEIISLYELKGTLTLIDFWAAWCGPCRVENPNIVNVYNQFKDQGFTVIGVSLDRPGAKEQWLNAIEDDRLDWHHISHLQHWEEPIAKQYGVRAIPKAYLVDQEGKIIAMDLRGPALGRAVAQYFENLKN